jgi:hypothetical protein
MKAYGIKFEKKPNQKFIEQRKQSLRDEAYEEVYRLRGRLAHIVSEVDGLLKLLEQNPECPTITWPDRAKEINDLRVRINMLAFY